MTWIFNPNTNWHESFNAFSNFKQTAKQQMFAQVSSTKPAYKKFLRDKVSVLRVKHSPKWCDMLQLLSDGADQSKTYESNYCAANESKMRSS